MKKIFILLAFVVATIISSAQTATFALANDTYKEVTTDYTLTNTTEVWFQFNAEKDYSCTQDYQVLLTKGTGSHTETTIVLYGRKFSNDSWTLIGSGTSGTITTTATVTISNVNHTRYRQYKVSLTGTGTGTTTISNQIFKVWLE